MAKSSTARKLDDAPLVQADRRPAFGGGGPPAPPVRPNTPIANNAWLAVLMFLGAEAMFFAGLIGAFLVFRIASPVWPPPFQPRLPSEVTGINTLILLASAVTMRLGLKAIQRGDRSRLVRLLSWTAAAGHDFFIDSRLRVVSPDSFRLDRVEQRLWRFILYDHRLSCVACFWRVRLVACRLPKGKEWKIHAGELRRLANLQHVLGLRRRLVADTLRAGLSLLIRMIDTPKSIR